MYAWLDSTPVLALSRLLAAALPRPLALGAAEAGGWAAHATLARPREALRRHGSGGAAPLVNYARTRADLFYLERLLEKVDGPADLPREAVYVSAHVGNWEMGGAWLARRFGLTVLAQEPGTPFSRFVERVRGRSGVRTLHGGAAGLRRFLEAPPPVGALIDRPAGRIPQAPLAYAWRHGLPLIPHWTLPTRSGRYRFETEPPVDGRPRPGESRAEGTARLAAGLEGVLARMRRRHVDQWFPFYEESVEKPPSHKGSKKPVVGPSSSGLPGGRGGGRSTSLLIRDFVPSWFYDGLYAP